MSLLHQWIDKQTEQKSQLITFSEALFGSRILSYVIYRLRYFTLNSLFTMSMHALEFYFLTVVFSQKHLGYLILFRAIISSLSAFWWGALEVMRTRVRSLFHFNQQKQLALELGKWQFLAFILGGGCFIASICYCFLALNQTRMQNSVSDFYISAIFFQFGLHLIVEVRRAAVFSLFRIARTISSLLLPAALGAILLVSLWWFIGGYVLALSTFLTAILSTVLSLHFIKRAFVYHQLPKLIWPKRDEIKKIFSLVMKAEFFFAGIANALISLESLLIWILYYSSSNYRDYSSYYFLFYFISPLMHASSAWPRLFYFDIKKYQNSSIHRLIQSFNTRVLHFSLLIGLFYWLIATLFTIDYFEDNTYGFSLLLIIIFTLRSSTSYLQIVAFSNRRYWDVIVSGIIALLSALGFLSIYSLLAQVVILFVFLIASYLYIHSPRLPPLKSSDKEYKFSSYIDWLIALANTKSSTIIFRFKFSEQLSFAHKILLKEAIENHLDYQHCLWINNLQLLLFIENNELNQKELLNQIIIGSAGIIEHYNFTQQANSGIEALHQAIKEKLLFNPQGKLSANSLVLPNCKQKMMELFKQKFPFGNYYEFNAKKVMVHSSQQIKENSDYYRLLLKKTYRCLRSPTELDDGLVISVCAYSDLEGNTLIFVILLSYENSKSVAEWKLAVFRAALQQFDCFEFNAGVSQ